MAISLFAANEGYLDDVPVNKVVDFEHALHNHFRNSSTDVIKKINETGDYNDTIASSFKAILEEFKANNLNW
jgi:F-type H+-transporting ATPase subunit alpha